MRIFLAFLVVVAFLHSGCASAPINLTPEANIAFQHNQIEKALDLVRDIAQVGAGLNPPVFSKADARVVTRWHEASIKVLYASADGWKAIILTSLTQLPMLLSPIESEQLAPYLALAHTLISQVN